MSFLKNIKNNKIQLAQIGLVLTTFVWGITFIMVKEALQDAPPFAFTAFRFMLASFGTLFILRKNILDINRLEIIGGIICGIFLFSGYGFQNFGLVVTTASKSAFITGVSIILVPVFLVIAGIQKIRLKIWGSVLLAVIGLFLLLNPSGDGINRGDILTMGCAASFGIHIIVQDRFTRKKVQVFQFFIVQATIVSILSFGGHILFETQSVIWSQRLIIALAITGIFATLAGISIMIWAQKVLSPTRTAIIFTMEPIFAALFAMLIAGEMLSIQGWTGGFLILLGIIWAETGRE